MQNRYRIKALKPNGEKVKITNKTPREIEKIHNAMTSNGYTNIRVIRELTTDELFIGGIMEQHNCGPKVALEIYKKISMIMATRGLELIRKDDLCLRK